MFSGNMCRQVIQPLFGRVDVNLVEGSSWCVAYLRWYHQKPSWLYLSNNISSHVACVHGKTTYEIPSKFALIKYVLECASYIGKIKKGDELPLFFAAKIGCIEKRWCHRTMMFLYLKDPYKIMKTCHVGVLVSLSRNSPESSRYHQRSDNSELSMYIYIYTIYIYTYICLPYV